LIDFDQIYEYVITAGIESLKRMKCVRGDEIEERCRFTNRCLRRSTKRTPRSKMSE